MARADWPDIKTAAASVANSRLDFLGTTILLGDSLAFFATDLLVAEGEEVSFICGAADVLNSKGCRAHSLPDLCLEVMGEDLTETFQIFAKLQHNSSKPAFSIGNLSWGIVLFQDEVALSEAFSETF